MRFKGKIHSKTIFWDSINSRLMKRNSKKLFEWIIPVSRMNGWLLSGEDLPISYSFGPNGTVDIRECFFITQVTHNQSKA